MRAASVRSPAAAGPPEVAGGGRLEQQPRSREDPSQIGRRRREHRRCVPRALFPARLLVLRPLAPQPRLVHLPGLAHLLALGDDGEHDRVGRRPGREPPDGHEDFQLIAGGKSHLQEFAEHSPSVECLRLSVARSRGGGSAGSGRRFFSYFDSRARWVACGMFLLYCTVRFSQVRNFEMDNG